MSRWGKPFNPPIHGGPDRVQFFFCLLIIKPNYINSLNEQPVMGQAAPSQIIHFDNST